MHGGYRSRIVMPLAFAMALLIIAAACGGGQPPTRQAAAAPTAAQPAATPTATRAPAPTPTPPPRAGQAVYGGVLTDLTSATPTVFDNMMQDESQGMLGSLYSSLVYYDWTSPGAVPIAPDLATTWSVSPDGLTWTFKLVTNATFHNGDRLTSRDIVLSLQRHTRKGGQVAVSPLLKNEVAEYVTPDESTVIIKLKRVRADFLPRLAQDNVTVMPSSLIEKLGGPEGKDVESVDQLIGSGPFKFARFEKDVRWVVEKNAKFYVQGKPYLDGVEFIAIADASTRIAALAARKGQIIYGMIVSFNDVNEIKRFRPEVVARQFTGSYYRYTHLNPNLPIFQDFNVRKALFLAYDRWGAIDTLEGGQGMAGPVLPEVGGYTVDEQQRTAGLRRDKTQDWAEVRRLLSAAGVASLKVPVLTHSLVFHKDANLYFVDSLKKAGIDASVDQAPDGTTFANRERACNFDVMAHRAGLDALDLSGWMIYYEKGATENRCKTPYPRLNDLFDQQATTLDSAKRLAIAKQMLDIVLNDPKEGLWTYNIYVGGYWLLTDPKVHKPVPKLVRSGLRYVDVWMEK